MLLGQYLAFLETQMLHLNITRHSDYCVSQHVRNR